VESETNSGSKVASAYRSRSLVGIHYWCGRKISGFAHLWWCK